MSFRKYGGRTYAATNNYVKNNVHVSNELYVVDAIGQPESYINCLSDLSGNFLNQGITVQANTFNATSDYHITDNIEPLDLTYYNVDNLTPVTYTNTKTGEQDIGLIPHELQEVYPFLVSGIKDGENNQSINYNGLIGLLIKEIQSLKAEVKTMKELIEYIDININ